MLRDIFNRAGLKRVDKDTRFPYEKVWDFAAKLIYIAIIAGICWLASAVLLLVFPAKWTLIVGLLNVIKFLGKWIFWITAIGALLCYIAGWIVPFFTRDQGDTYHELHNDDPHIRRRP